MVHLTDFLKMSTFSQSHLMAQERTNLFVRAIIQGDDGLMNSMLNEGVSVDDPSSNGCTPLRAAIAVDNLDFVKQLIQHGVTIDPEEGGCPVLHYVIRRGNFEMMKLIVDNGADIDRPDQRGTTPFICAINQYEQKMAEWLWERGARASPPSTRFIGP